MASYKDLLEQIRTNRLEYSRLEKELEEIENSPIRDTDVVVKYTGSMGSEYSVSRITNMEKERVKELLEQLTEIEYEEWDGNLEEYLEKYSVEVIPVLSTAESRWDGYPPFYDLEYDLDTNKVYDSIELSVGEQAENFVNRIEFGEAVFNDEERKLVINYADQLGDTEAAFALARALRDIKDIQNRSRIIETAKNEIELYTGQENRFGIYQIKSGEELHYHRFEPLDRLEQYGRKVEKANYDLIYTASLQEGQSLDDIYEEFNLYHPENFRGHSLSVSDIVLIHRNGENHSYYVDRFGFQEVPQFQKQIKAQISVINKERSFVDHYYIIEDLQKQGSLDIKRFQNMDEALQEYFRLANDKRKAFGVQNSQPMPGTLDFLQCQNGVDKVILDYEVLKGWNNPEIVDVVQKVEEAIDVHDVMIAYKVGNCYLSIQSTEEGFDYTIYNSDYREWDGGIYDDPFISLPEVIDEILGDQMLGFDDCQVINYDDFMEEVENTEYFPKQAYESLKELMNSGADEIAFKSGYGYVSVQKVPKGYDYIIYDSDWKEINGNSYDNPDASMEEAVWWIFKEQRMGTLNCEPYNFDELVKATLQADKERMKQGTVTPTSQISRKEWELNGLSRHEIEEGVLSYAQAMIDDYDGEIKLLAARTYGSRTAGIHTVDSDLDVVLEFEGDIREDIFFEILHEEGLLIGGMRLDINPITSEKSGTIEEFLERVNENLEEKVKNAREVTSDKQKEERMTSEPEQMLTFYVAECMEFHPLGEYHENLTLEEAISLYEAIPADRMNAIKGIGFTLHTIENGKDTELSMDLLKGMTIDIDIINSVTEFRESSLVQQAIQEIIRKYPDKEIWDVETRFRENAKNLDKECIDFAVDFDRFEEDYDTYEYGDTVESKEENIMRIYHDLCNGNGECIRQWLQDVIDEEEPEEEVKQAQIFLKRLDDLAERRAKNPIAQTEKLKEVKSDQFEQYLNSKDEKCEEKSLSIMERIAHGKHKCSRGKEPSKNMKLERE